MKKHFQVDLDLDPSRGVRELLITYPPGERAAAAALARELIDGLPAIDEALGGQVATPVPEAAR